MNISKTAQAEEFGLKVREARINWIHTEEEHWIYSINMQEVGVTEEGVRGRVRWTYLLWHLLKEQLRKKQKGT